MKNILITGGPTIEPIDEVMKITNFSTGSLSLALGKEFLQEGHRVCLVLNHIVNVGNLEKEENARIIRIETTEEMLKAIKNESEQSHYDVVIHASAVGDYRPTFSFRMEDLAEEILAKEKAQGGFGSTKELLDIMVNPDCKLDGSSKISSYQPNLTVKLGLTPKIISHLREWFPKAKLVGCKLLDNVTKEELYAVATKLCIKNNVDYILANDLADLRQGKPARYLVNKDGFTGTTLKNAKEIFEFAVK